MNSNSIHVHVLYCEQQYISVCYCTFLCVFSCYSLNYLDTPLSAMISKITYVDNLVSVSVYLMI